MSFDGSYYIVMIAVLASARLFAFLMASLCAYSACCSVSIGLF